MHAGRGVCVLPLRFLCGRFPHLTYYVQARRKSIRACRLLIDAVSLSVCSLAQESHDDSAFVMALRRTCIAQSQAPRLAATAQRSQERQRAALQQPDQQHQQQQQQQHMRDQAWQQQQHPAVPAPQLVMAGNRDLVSICLCSSRWNYQLPSASKLAFVQQ